MAKRPRLLTTLRRTIAAFREHNASRFGAALAFYIIFTIAPTLLIAIAIAGSLFGRVWAERAILDRIGGSVGSAAGIAIAAMIRSAAQRREGWLTTTLGITTLLFGLSGVYRQVDDALRTIWRRSRTATAECSTCSGSGSRRCCSSAPPARSCCSPCWPTRRSR